MKRLPPLYPHQAVSDWIATNDVHFLTDFVGRVLLEVTWDDRPTPLDYDVCGHRARWQIERLSYLTPALLDDMCLPHDIQVRVRTA